MKKNWFRDINKNVVPKKLINSYKHSHTGPLQLVPLYKRH